MTQTVPDEDRTRVLSVGAIMVPDSLGTVELLTVELVIVELLTVDTLTVEPEPVELLTDDEIEAEEVAVIVPEDEDKEVEVEGRVGKVGVWDWADEDEVVSMTLESVGRP